MVLKNTIPVFCDQFSKRSYKILSSGVFKTVLSSLAHFFPFSSPFPSQPRWHLLDKIKYILSVGFMIFMQMVSSRWTVGSGMTTGGDVLPLASFSCISQPLRNGTSREWLKSASSLHRTLRVAQSASSCTEQATSLQSDSQLTCMRPYK